MAGIAKAAESIGAEKKKALDNAMHQIEKEFGSGAIMRLGDMGARMNLEVIPTGSLALDIAVGVGGYPRGRVIEIYGPESSGKTTLALHAIAEAQKWAAWLLSSMRNMRLIRFTRIIWAWTRMIC